MSRPELLYPQRRRCRTCRRYFAWTIINRQYDSYACAGMFDVTMMPVEQLPRQCSRFDKQTGQRVAKRWFDTPEEAQMVVDSSAPAAKPYYCNMHGVWHIGTLKGSEEGQ